MNKNLIDILNQADFTLRQFMINIMEFYGTNVNIQFTPLLISTNKALGVLYYTFTFLAPAFNYKQQTKRNILSSTAKLFDPISLLSPIIMKLYL